MLKESVVLLPNCSNEISMEGKPVKAVGFYSNDTNKRLNTIAIHTLSFTGRIYLYGSLKLKPESDLDWAIIPLGETTDYLEYDNLNNSEKVIKENSFINIKGGYTWFKAVMDRSYIEVLNDRKPTTYTPGYVMTGLNVLNPESVPMNLHEREIPKDQQIKPYALKNYGNVEKILLCY